MERGCSARLPLPWVGERRLAPGAAGTGRPPVPARARPAGHAGCAARDAGAGGGRGGGGRHVSRRAEGRPPALGQGSPWRRRELPVVAAVPRRHGSRGVRWACARQRSGVRVRVKCAPRTTAAFLSAPLNISKHPHSSPAFPRSPLNEELPLLPRWLCVHCNLPQVTEADSKAGSCKECHGKEHGVLVDYQKISEDKEYGVGYLENKAASML
ncbi:uncharacterized protein LOC127059640 [Serinus canaria]|uniref:uncharacterized protein LOC127059640 n=1 Tax=Serinus canaria TaxID=9135 RepID=UPI0021CC5511|nr:uncharacterized protein LOC127059640 [Serinus canaria]